MPQTYNNKQTRVKVQCPANATKGINTTNVADFKRLMQQVLAETIARDTSTHIGA